MLKTTVSKCKCGRKVKGVISPFMSATTMSRSVCLCGRLNYIDDRPVDWTRAAKGKLEVKVKWKDSQAVWIKGLL